MSLQAPPPLHVNVQPRTISTPSPAVAAQPQPTQRPPSTTTTTAATNNAQALPEPQSAFQRAKHRVKVLLGYAGPRRAQRDRQEIVRLIALLAYSFVQVRITITAGITIIHSEPRP